MSAIEQVWTSPEIFRVPVRLPQNPLRNLNCYVIRTPERTLIIDTGFNRPECKADLLAGLETLGLDWSRTALFLTHLHSDHTGLVWELADRGVPVYMGQVERDYYQSYTQAGGIPSLFPDFLREGFPQEELDRQAEGNQGMRYAPRPGYPIIPVADGQLLPMEGIEIIAVHTPGHTPGHTALYLPREKLLFSGDHILFDITPNISVWPGISDSLSDYITSLQKIRALPIRATFPAHRAAGKDVRVRIDQIIDHHQRRLEEIFQAVAAHPGCTAYDTAGRIRWSVHGLPWAEFPPHQRWFAMGETVAHLCTLMRKGRLHKREQDGLFHYYPTEPDTIILSGGTPL